MATAFLEPTTETIDDGAGRGRWEYWVTCLTWAAVVVGIVWRIGRYLAQFPIWGDEAHITVNFIGRDFWGMTKQLDYAQIAPVLFLWIEWGMYHLSGPSELSLRFVPLLAGIAALFLFRRLCTLTLPPLVAAIAVSMLAVSYFPVRHATEVKPYSFDLFFTLALFVPAVRWVREPEHVRWLVLLTILVPFAIAGSYPAVFSAGAVSLYLLPAVWRTTSRSVRGWYVAYNLALIGTFLAHLLLVGREQLDPEAGTVQHAMHDYWKDWFPPANFGLPLWLLRVHTGAMLAYPAGGPNFGSTATSLLCLAGLWTTWRTRRLGLLTLCVVPFALSLLAAILQRYPYGGSARLAQHLAPAICILASFGIVSLLSLMPRLSSRRGGVIAILLGLGVFGVVGLALTFAKQYKHFADVQIRDMVHDLAARIEPGDAIVIANPRHKPHPHLSEPNLPRPTLYWYLRQLDLPLLHEDKMDGTKFEGRRLWYMQLRVEADKKLDPAKAASRSVAYYREYAFAPDAKDMPPQYCEVYLWVKEP